MKNINSVLLTLVLLTSASQRALAQNSCGQVFNENGVYLSSKRFSIENQLNPKLTKEITLELLKMTALTRDNMFNKKEVVEKGTLILASEIQLGWSLEFEYTADHRGAEPLYRLSQTKLVKPNGERSTLDKEALKVDNSSFGKKFFSSETLTIDPGIIDIEVPLIIQGSIYKNLNYWATRSEFLKRPELQTINSKKSAATLRSKMWARSTTDYARNVIKKQSFKFALIGLAIYLYNTKDSLLNQVITSDPWEGLVKSSRELLAHEEARNLVSRHLKDDFDIHFEIKSASNKDELKTTKLESILPKLDSLALLETNLNSEAEIIILSKDKQRRRLSMAIFNDASELNDLTDASILVHFPKQKRALWLLQDPTLESNTENPKFKFAVVALDASNSQLAGLYEKISSQVR